MVQSASGVSLRGWWQPEKHPESVWLDPASDSIEITDAWFRFDTIHWIIETPFSTLCPDW